MLRQLVDLCNQVGVALYILLTLTFKEATKRGRDDKGAEHTVQFNVQNGRDQACASAVNILLDRLTSSLRTMMHDGTLCNYPLQEWRPITKDREGKVQLIDFHGPRSRFRYGRKL